MSTIPAVLGSSLLRTVDDARHLGKVKCPVLGCAFARRFVETAITLADPDMTKTRREEYLRLCHEAGDHLESR